MKSITVSIAEWVMRNADCADRMTEHSQSDVKRTGTRGAVIVPRVFTLLLLALVTTVSADISFSVKADRTQAAVGEQVVITATVVSTKKLKNPAAPPVPASEFTVLRTSQNQRQSSSTQIINNKVIHQKNFTYLFYYFITAKRAGSFTFPALAFTSGGKSYSSSPFILRFTSQQIRNPDVRVSIRTGKDRLFVGEQSVVTLEVAQKSQSSVRLTEQGFIGAINAVEEALGTHFSVSRLFGNQLARRQKRIGGEIYDAFDLPFSIIPLKPATVKIPSIAFEYQELKRVRSRDPFESFFGGSIFGSSVRGVPKVAHSRERSLTATALPTPPKAFSGAVGSDFSLTADIAPRTVAAGEAMTLKINLEGTVHPGALSDPSVPPMDDFEVFTPEKSSRVDTTARGIATRKTYKYLLIPQQQGNYEVPEMQWTYFDPAAETFKTLRAGPFSLAVTEGEARPKAQSRYLTQEEIREVGKDILYIKQPSSLRQWSREPYKNPLFFILFPLPFAMVLGSVLFRIQAGRRDRDRSRAVRNKAYRNAMKKIDKNATTGQTRDLAATLSEAIEQYMTQRFGFAAAGKTLDELSEELSKRDVRMAVINDLRSFQEDLDRFRFAGQYANSDTAPSLIRQARALIGALEKSAKKEKKAK
jgi:hypothetical protein